jgi:thiamine biosynthesis protein ThiS
MKVILNDREEELTGDLMSISDMLREKKFSFRMRIIKINGKLISREKYDATYLSNGDNIQMIYLMSGG